VSDGAASTGTGPVSAVDALTSTAGRPTIRAPEPPPLTRRQALAVVVILSATAAIELWMGRLPFGPDGRFGWLETDIWSSALSQRVADPYSFSHVIHGLLFYALLRALAPRQPLELRFVTAVLLEAGWEVLENSPIIINRYREVTIALGYVGDSVLNSLSDVVMMALGFGLAARLPVRWSVGLALAMELGVLAVYRDNLALNIVMLLFPLETVRTWQMQAR